MLSIVKFETRYPPNKEPLDMVLLAPQGAAFDKTQTWHRVHTLIPPADVDNRTKQSDHYQAMIARWEQIKPAYEAWKEGTAIATTGTPLEAWPAMSAEMVKAFKAMSINTVEGVRDMSDSALSGLRFPNARRFPSLAASFLDGRSAVEKDEELAAMRERMEAMEAMLEGQAAEKPKRGRPRKTTEADAA